MVEKFNKSNFVENLDNALQKIETATELAATLAEEKYNKIVFVGCGAPYRITNILNYWLKLKIQEVAFYNYLPADLMNIDPYFIDDQTIVLFGSYSGTTEEMVKAAKFYKTKTCLSIGITRFDDSPMGKEMDKLLNFGDTRLGDYSRFIITTAFVSSFVNQRDPSNWKFHDQLIKSLFNLPNVLAETIEQSELQVKVFSEKYYQTNSMFIVGHGPMYNIAYVLAFCSFMEMQWIHATPIIGAEFFHGPFEIIDGSFPTIVLIGEGPTREQGIRVKKFGEKYGKKFEIFDSKEYAMKGIDEKLRYYFAPIILDAATRRLMDYFAEKRNHDKSKRRYMGVVDY